MLSKTLAPILLVLSLCAGTACSSVPTNPGRPDLDTMLQRLRTTHDPAEAQMLEVAIRHVWARSGDSGTDRLMERAVTEVHTGDYDNALDALDQVVRAAPGYVEGWNLRATVHYLRSEYVPAIADIHHVLVLEPRHFGALAGLGRILLALDDKRSALKAFEAALKINPHLDEVQDEVDTLQDELAGIPI